MRTIIAAPMTTGSRPAGFRVALRFQGKDGLVLLDQVRTIDKQRLVKKLGQVSANTLKTTLVTLRTIFEE
ncbi:type II toxin-antitoxin system PemK/MazF family toxin [Phyllobacterium zundukense]|uniref:type II toxin-antitoxin system PemK/MazF family toxin n=1 Tax=Phyllobacterium zundukense TaxID=1867719 RepID=UPI001F2FD1C9|nr:type II toxin-antitoxin system PemK/MazF family toxin [Phyllobacterium zundukense]